MVRCPLAESELRRARHRRVGPWGEVIGLTGARQTIVTVDEQGGTLGPGDPLERPPRRCSEAATLAGRTVVPKRRDADGHPPPRGRRLCRGGGLAGGGRTRTGCHGRWLLAPRECARAAVDRRGSRPTRRWPPAPACTTCRALRRSPARLRAAGAVSSGRPSEVSGESLGHAARSWPPRRAPGRAPRRRGPAVRGARRRRGHDRPMVSWGTAANVSRPVEAPPDDRPFGIAVTGPPARVALEAGVAAAGDWLAWLERITGRSATRAGGRRCGPPAGARGVATVPWLDGARAPWWADEPGRASSGSAVTTTPVISPGGDRGSRVGDPSWARGGRDSRNVRGLALAGGGDARPWPEILGAVTRLTTVRRRQPGRGVGRGRTARRDRGGRRPRRR